MTIQFTVAEKINEDSQNMIRKMISIKDNRFRLLDNVRGLKLYGDGIKESD